MSFLSATVKSAVIIAWGFGQEEVKASSARHVCHATALAPVFLGTAWLRSLCSSTEGAAPPGSRQEWAARLHPVPETLECSKSWENKCVQTAAL